MLPPAPRQPGTSKGQQPAASSSSSALSEPRDPDSGGAPCNSGGGPRQRGPPLDPSPSAPAAPAHGAPAVAQWQGRLLHRRSSRVADLCSLAVQMPAVYHDQMPAVLYATELAHRRAVPLGRHVVCRCTLLATTTQRQLAALAAMAQAQLVAVAPLQLCELVLVPYFDSHARVRVVGFLRVFGD